MKASPIKNGRRAAAKSRTRRGSQPLGRSAAATKAPSVAPLPDLHWNHRLEYAPRDVPLERSVVEEEPRRSEDRTFEIRATVSFYVTARSCEEARLELLKLLQPLDRVLTVFGVRHLSDHAEVNEGIPI